MMCRSLRGAVALIVFVAFSTGVGVSAAREQARENLGTLDQQIDQLIQAGKYIEAVDVGTRALAVAEHQFGKSNPNVAKWLNLLGFLYQVQGRLAEAEPLYKRSLAIYQKAFGPDNLDVAKGLNAVAVVYSREGRDAEAQPLFERSLAIKEKVLGPNDIEVARALDNLSILYEKQHRVLLATRLLERSLAIKEKALGPEHRDVAEALSDLAKLYVALGFGEKAPPLYLRSIAIREKAFGPDDLMVARPLSSLAQLFQEWGLYAEAAVAYERILAIDEKAHGLDHPNVAADLNNIAMVYQAQGRYAEAEPRFKRSLAIYDAALGPDHPRVAIALENLGGLYQVLGRNAEAIALVERSMAIREKAFGPDDLDVARTLNDLGVLYQGQGRDAEAVLSLERSVAIKVKMLGREDPEVAGTLSNLAETYRRQGRYDKAEAGLKLSLAIYAETLPFEHPAVLGVLNYLATLYLDQGNYSLAEQIYQRGLGIAQKLLGPEHPGVAESLDHLAYLSFVQSDWAAAAGYWRRSTAIVEGRAKLGLADVRGGQFGDEARQMRSQFQNLVKAGDRLVPQGGSPDAMLFGEMFAAAQWAQNSEAASSLAQMAARTAKGVPELAAIVRERQDLVGESQAKDKQLITAKSENPAKRKPDTEKALADRLAAIDTALIAIDQRLTKDFPDYAALASPQPISVSDVQGALRKDEALVLFLDTPEAKPTPEETFIWLVTKTDVRWVRSELGTIALTREVSALRCGLDREGAWFNPDGSSNAHCTDLLSTDLLKVAYTDEYEKLTKPLPFDLNRAHALYKALFGEIEDLIKDKQLLIVPSGPLTQLPFQVLVTAPPKVALPGTSAEYRDVAWLARKNAITVLPAVSSLKALRELAKQSQASEPFVGFGNPLLDGDPDAEQDASAKFEIANAAKRAREKRCDPTLRERFVALFGFNRSTRAMTQGLGQLVDIEKIRRQIPLPETADELCAVAHELGVDPTTHLYLGERATETEVKRLSEGNELQKYKIVEFATHGAVAGDISVSEPGLILTPPKQATENDDGYLSASEIAGLKLDADWVILSACNTAASGAQGAEALSGLARAFIYAGARALLVSHWEVNSYASVKLITGAVDELKSDRKIGRAEALRISMLKLMAKTDYDVEAHPAFWAPFVVVGEGASVR
jgi:CHAT domain-containing protein